MLESPLMVSMGHSYPTPEHILASRMWRRLPIYQRPKEPAIGNPVLIESSYPQEDLDQLPNVSDLQNRGHNFENTHEDRGSRDVPRQLPPLPFGIVEPLSPVERRPVSEVPTASVYSQPSPPQRHYRFQRNSEVSTVSSIYSQPTPPHSPDMQRTGRPRSPADNGPMMATLTEVPDMPHIPDSANEAGSKPKSGIPVLNRGKKTPQVNKFWNWGQPKEQEADRSSTITKWDDFSGEPTFGNKGKPPRTRPGEFVENTGTADLNPVTRRGFGTKTTVFGGRQNLGPKKDEDKEKTNRAKAETGFMPKQPWRGVATGRHALVDPVATDRSKAPPMPTRNPRRPSPPLEIRTDSAASGELGSKGEIRRVVSGSAEDASETLRPNARTAGDSDEVKPTPPLKAGRNSPPRILTSPTSIKSSEMNIPSPMSGGGSRPISTASGRDKALPDPHSSRTSAAQGGANQLELEKRLQRLNISQSPTEQPAPQQSGWGWFSKAPAAPAAPATPTKPLPTPAAAPTPILNRRRPIPGPSNNVDNRKATTRKEPAHPSPPVSPTSSTPSRRQSRIMTAEAKSIDHITRLQTQLDTLHAKRGGLQQSLQELGRLLPPNPSTHDVYERGELKRQADFIKDQIADVMKDEHDIGLKLHRAWRKRERMDEWGNETSLWVRRVTS